MASWGQLDFFCVNDTTDDAAAQDARLLDAREALEHMFPRPSGFEKVNQPVALERSPSGTELAFKPAIDDALQHAASLTERA
jgi:hypothetical protein